MPGILGVVGKREPRLDGVFSEMLVRCRLQPWYVQTARRMDFEGTDTRGAFGQCGLGILEERHAPVAESAGGMTAVVVCGEIFNANHLFSLLKMDAVPVFISPAELILAGYETLGKAFFENVDGRFQAAIFDLRRREVILTCDRFATRPLYWTRTAERFLFASEIKTLLSDADVSRKDNLSAITDFFTFGHYLGQETSVEAVRVLPPAAWFTYSADGHVLREDTYWMPAPATPADVKKITVEDVVDAFHAAVRRQSDGTPHLGISLSGGLDARSVLGMIERPENVTSVVLGVPGSADLRLAAQLAELAGTNHLKYELNTGFLRTYETQLAEMVRLTDGQYLSSSIVIPTLPFYRQNGIRTLLRGHAGELMHMSKAYAFSLTDAELSGELTTADGVFGWAASHLQAYMLDGVTGPVLKDVSPREFQEFSRDSLRRALEDANIQRNEPAAQTVWALYLRQRVFREIPLSMRKFDSQVNIRLPFLDNRLVDMLLTLPPGLKMDETLQQAILRKYRPDFLRVKNVNTGTFIGAGRLRQTLAELKQKVFAKLGVPGYQPYEKMGLWLRRELAPVVDEMLLSQRALSRGVFHPDTVKNVVTGHNAGRNHTYLILAMMIFEARARFFES